MTGDKETRKPGQHRPESERMLNVLVSQELVDAAATCKVLWAKVKGHPYWPVSPPVRHPRTGIRPPSPPASIHPAFYPQASCDISGPDHVQQGGR